MTRDPDSGPMKRRCSGTASSTGEQCRLPPIRGGTVCHKHGGSAPQVKAAAARRVAEASALAELHRLGVEPLANPLVALAELAAEAREWQVILRGQVAELESLSLTTPAGVEQVRAVVLLFERAMDRAATFAATLVRLDIDDRLVKLNARISEAMGARVAGVIEGILEDLGHRDPRHDPAVAPVVVARLERLLAAGDDGG